MRAHPVKPMDKWCTRFQQCRSALGFKQHQLAQRSSCVCAVKVCFGNAECPHVFLRQVNAAGGAVLGDILPVLKQLQGATDPIGQFGRLRRTLAENIEHQPPYRVGRELTVTDQLLESRIPRDPLIDQVGADELVERL